MEAFIKDYNQLINALNKTTTHIVNSNFEIDKKFMQEMINLEAERLLDYPFVNKYAQSIINSTNSINSADKIISNIAAILGEALTNKQISLEGKNIIEPTNQLITYMSINSAKISSSLTNVMPEIMASSNKGYLTDINYAYTYVGYKAFECFESAMLARYSYTGILPFGKVGALIHAGKALFKFFEALDLTKDSEFPSFRSDDQATSLPYDEQTGEGELSAKQNNIHSVTDNLPKEEL